MSEQRGSPKPAAPAPSPAPERPPAPEEAPVPVDVQSVALTGLFVLACMGALVAARRFFLPLAFSLMLYFLFIPLVRWLKRLRLPESVGAALVVVTLVGGLGFGIYALSWPAAEWMDRAPQGLARVQSRARSIMRRLEPVRQTAAGMGSLAGGRAEKGSSAPAPAAVPGVGAKVLSGVQSFLDNLVVVAALVYFLLASGDSFLRTLVRVLPTLRDKIKAVAIARETEKQISTYLFTATLENLALGVATAVAMYLLGMPSPILWGALAAITNYIIVLGGLFTTVALALAAVVTFDDLGRALLVPGTFLLINLLESNFLYPLIVGKRMTLNPVVVFVGVMFWLWAWGVVGALLAVPMLAAFKIFCERIEALHPVAEFLGEPREEPAERPALAQADAGSAP